MESTIQLGIRKGLVKLNEDESRITYIHLNKSYSFKDPEEQVRANTFINLVIEFKYKAQRIDIEKIMPDRVPNNFADIVVYDDDAKKTPYIVVECKRPDVSDAEFKQAIEQGFAYAAVLTAKYLWITSGISDRYFNVGDFPKGEREKNEIPLIPEFGKEEFEEPIFVKGGKDLRALKKLTEKQLTDLFKKAHDSLWYGGKRNEKAGS